MPDIRLPDGSVRQFDEPVSGLDLAASIGSGLAKAAVAVRVNGEMRDLTRLIDSDAEVAVVARESDEGLELLRHDAAHVWPRRCRSCSPVRRSPSAPRSRTASTTTSSANEPFTPDDLAAIEETHGRRSSTATRRSSARSGTGMTRRLLSREGETSRPRMGRRAAGAMRSRLYRQGDWLDSVPRPHLPSTGKLRKAFKLMQVSPAPIGVATPATRSCSASTAPRGATTRS